MKALTTDVKCETKGEGSGEDIEFGIVKTLG